MAKLGAPQVGEIGRLRWSEPTFVERPKFQSLTHSGPSCLSADGIAEMIIVALALGIGVAFVVCCPDFRPIFIVAATPALYRGVHRV
jgi:hypothetical protein